MNTAWAACVGDLHSQISDSKLHNAVVSYGGRVVEPESLLPRTERGALQWISLKAGSPGDIRTDQRQHVSPTMLLRRAHAFGIYSRTTLTEDICVLCLLYSWWLWVLNTYSTTTDVICVFHEAFMNLFAMRSTTLFMKMLYDTFSGFSGRKHVTL